MLNIEGIGCVLACVEAGNKEKEKKENGLVLGLWFGLVASAQKEKEKENEKLVRLVFMT